MKYIIPIFFALIYSSILAQSVAVGSMNGSFAVNEMGAATYTIPIDVPQGINGLRPNIALTYNSQSGNGVCGMGFSVAAASAITRVAKDIYHDGVARGIKYDSSDAFALDGTRLVTNAQNQLCPENSPFDIVTQSAQGGFVVKLQNGNTAYYGQTADSRATVNGIAYTWYLNKVEDTHGNTITYNYITDNGCVYLQQISYGGNSKTASGLTNIVVFAYENRTDAVPFNVKGVRCEMKKRLKTIQTKTNGTLRNTYTLSYTNADYFSQLTQISVQCGSTSLPSISFAYGKNQAQSTPTQISSIVSSINSTTLDINGDGLCDIATVSSNSVQLYCAQKSDASLSFSKKSITTDCAKVSKETTTQGDVNGDGRTDLILLTNNQATEAIKKQSDGIYSVNVGKDEVAFDVGDFFNDGKSGLLYLKKKASGATQCKLLYYNANGTTKTLSGQLTLPNTTQTVKVSDWNGDGMADLLVVGSAGYTIFWNNGVASTSFPFSDSNKTTGSTFKASDIIDYGDFDGDGLLDVLLLDNSGSKNIGKAMKLSYKLTLVTNNGNGTFTKNNVYSILKVIDGDYQFDDFSLEAKILDINNDEKDDVLLETNNAKSIFNYDRDWLISDGKALKLYDSNTSVNSIEDILKGDFDGDGNEEIMAGFNDLYNGGGTRLSTSMYLYANKANQPTYKLTSVTEANNGAQMTISYSTLSDKDVYKRGSSSAYPLADVTLPFSVVKQTNSMVAGRTYITKYRYEGLRAHMQGLGYLGFTTVEVNDGTTGAKRTMTITALNTQYYEPSQIVTTTTQDGKTSKVETIRNFVSKGGSGKCHFSYTFKTKSTDIYGDVTTTQNTFDSTYGYITKQRTEYGGSSMYKQMEYQSFVKVGGVYRPQTTILTQKHEDASDVFSQKTTYIYSSITGDVTQMTENAATKPVIHKYTYDVFGNVLTHATSADGIPTVTATNTYDATHRFVATKKSSANSITSTFTYDILGLLKQSVQTAGSVSLKTTYTYDDLGNIATIIHPDSTKTTYTRGWGSSAQKRHYIKEQRTAAAPITKWFDNADREVESSTTGEKGIALSSKNTYNDTFGTIASATSSVGALSLTNTYTYDNLGMLTQVNYGSGSTATFSYARRQHSTTFAGMRTTTQTLDAWGGVKTVTDGMITACNYTYASNGRPTSVKYADQSGLYNTETTMQYDTQGRQTQLTDPNAGTTTYEYDALGRIVKQTDARGNVTTNTYNASGLLTKQTCGPFTTNYTYNSSLLLTEEKSNNQSIQYSYDKLNRLSQKTYTIDGTKVSFTYTYNNKGQIVTKTLPDGVKESYIYDANGNITTISINDTKIWELSNYTGKQRTIAMGGLTATKIYSEQGRLISTSMQKQDKTLHTMTYTYDNATGNMTSRTGMTSAKETFTYDNFDRLTASTTNGKTHSISYALNGNITNKTGIGAYTYAKTRPHAVTQVTNVEKLISQTAQTVTYNAFNKASKITQGQTMLSIEYGPNRQRSKTTYSDGQNASITLYAGEYERRTENGTTTGWNYIYSPDGDLVAICKSTRGTTTIYHAETDHLGSIIRLYDTNGNIAFSASYDAWGLQTISKNAINLRRGYCQHEHWDEFDLIDMNGRMYDPSVGRFLSPDPYVQNATNPQNFNRYSYCLNNPLKYTDPSGMKQVITNNDMSYNPLNKNVSSHFACGVESYIKRNNTNSGYSGSSFGYVGNYNSSNIDGAYYISNPASITDYYTSGMSWNDWIDSQVQTGNASILLGGVSVVAYDQASYDRAAREIWNQVHYGTDYSGGSGYSNAVSQSYGRGGSGGKHSVSANVSASAAIANNMANIVGTATSTTSYSARNLSKAKQAKLGYNAIGKIGKGATIVGVATTAISVGAEIINGDVNTHTFVDIGIGVLAVTSIVVNAPIFALSVAIVGTAYGLASVCGFSETIDKATDNWGRKVIYKRDDEDY